MTRKLLEEASQQQINAIFGTTPRRRHEAARAVLQAWSAQALAARYAELKRSNLSHSHEAECIEAEQKRRAAGGRRVPAKAEEQLAERIERQTTDAIAQQFGYPDGDHDYEPPALATADDAR